MSDLASLLAAHPELSSLLRSHEKHMDRAEFAETLRSLQTALHADELRALRDSARNAFEQVPLSNLTIGGRDGIHPSVLDMRTEIPTQRSDWPASLPPQMIVWVPVVLSPRLTKTMKGSYPSYQAGSTSIRESFATAVFIRPQWSTSPTSLADPLNTGKFMKVERSLTAYAVVNVHHREPHEVHEILDRRLEQEDLESVSPTSDIDGELDTPSRLGMPINDTVTPPFSTIPRPSPRDRFSPFTKSSESRR